MFTSKYKGYIGRTSSKLEWLSVRYEMDKNFSITERSVYSSFDFMRDIGGIFFFAATICSVGSTLFNYNKLENKLVSQLYKIPKLELDTSKKSFNLNADNQSVSHEMSHSLKCGRRKCCGNGDHIDSWFRLGRQTLAHEINVQRIIRSLRVFETFLEKKVPDAELKQIIKDSNKMTLKELG